MADDPTKTLTQVSFDFEKSPLFRTVHVDGVFGGPTPQGLIQIALYNERLPIPKSITYEVTDGALGKEKQPREGRQNIFREVEVNLVMAPETAKALQDWLGEQLGKLEKLKEPPR